MQGKSLVDKKVKINKTKIAECLAKFYLRNERGNSLIHFFTAIAHDFIMVALGMDLVYRYLHFYIPYWLIIIVVLSIPIIQYLIGYIDERIGFWKFQNRYRTKELNPFLKEMGERMRRIEEKLSK